MVGFGIFMVIGQQARLRTSLTIVLSILSLSPFSSLSSALPSTQHPKKKTKTKIRKKTTTLVVYTLLVNTCTPFHFESSPFIQNLKEIENVIHTQFFIHAPYYAFSAQPIFQNLKQNRNVIYTLFFIHTHTHTLFCVLSLTHFCKT